MRIRWTDLAQRDFTNICDYTEEQNGPAAARRTALRIYEAIDLLAQFPGGDRSYRDSWYPTLRKKREGWGTRRW